MKTKSIDEKQLREVLQIPENVELEFKESSEKLSKDFWETYSAFANTVGGFIILGIKDKPREIVGVKNPQSTITEIFDLVHNPEKVSRNVLNDQHVKQFTVENKDVITIYVPELPIKSKPLYLRGNLKNVFIRGSEGDYQATEEDLRRFVRNADDEADNDLLGNYSIKDLNLSSVLKFKNIMDTRMPEAHFLEKDNMAFLEEMGVFQLDKEEHNTPKLTLAGLLFLGKLQSIQRVLPHFHLDYINKRDRGNTRWTDRVSTGDLQYRDLNLFEYYEIVRNKLRLTINDTFELDEKSIRKNPFVLDPALREALANMLIHADYRDAGTDIKVVVDDFYYTFENPGIMKVTKEQFFAGGKSLPRNNTLITFFRRIGASERAGSGGPEIKLAVEQSKYRMPELKTDLKCTSLKIWSIALADSIEGLTLEDQKVLSYIREVKIAKIRDIQEGTGLASHIIRKALKRLIEKDVIQIIGKARATAYKWKPSLIEQVAELDRQRDLLIHKGGNG